MEESTEYQVWVYDQLQPEEQIHHRRPKREPSGIGELFRARENAPDRPVDEAEQERMEDEYLKQFGV